MGYNIGYDTNHGRYIGYGVPAFCEHPACDVEIDRGMGYSCGGGMPCDDETCGLYFCGNHGGGSKCTRCEYGRPAYHKKGEHPKWVDHILTDSSWADWRRDNPGQVDDLKRLQKGL